MRENVKREIIVSGYGPGATGSASISLYSMTDKLKLDRQLWSDRITAPSFLCTYQDMCFAIREEDNSGSVLLYQRAGDEYVLKDEYFLEGGALCHIVYQPKNQTLYCSFYLTGHVGAIKVENYHFAKLLSFLRMEPEKAGDLTRAHCCALEPEGNRVLTTNIALDRIYIFEAEDGSLLPNTRCENIQLEKGIGPRHLKFHPIQNYLYVITEYSSEILVFHYLHDDIVPKLTLLQKISALPGGFHESSTGSTIDITEDGRFLYAANRGADTIAVFDIHVDGTLEKMQDISCQGRNPRHIALTKDDAALMIANQDSNEIVILGVDEQDGKLTDVITRIPFISPSYAEEL